jgi:hypothetical protein
MLATPKAVGDIIPYDAELFPRSPTSDISHAGLLVINRSSTAIMLGFVVRDHTGAWVSGEQIIVVEGVFADRVDQASVIDQIDSVNVTRLYTV